MTPPQELAELIERFEATMEIRACLHTARGYSMNMRECHGWLEAALQRPPQLEDLTRKRLQSWLDSLRSDKPATVQRKASAVKRFLKWLVLEEEIEVPEQEPLLCLPRQPRRTPKFLMPEQAESLIAAPARFAKPRFVRRDTFILEMLYGAGLRGSELLGLDLSEVHLDVPRKGDLSAHVLGKGQKERWVVCGPTVRKAYADYLGERDLILKGHSCPAVIVTQEKGRMGRNRLGKLVGYYGQKIGLKCWPHLLRHTCATHLIWEGGELRAVADVLGHADTQITCNYTSSNLKGIRRAMSRHPRFDLDRPARPDLELEDLLPALVQALPLLERLEALLPALPLLERLERVLPALERLGTAPRPAARSRAA